MGLTNVSCSIEVRWIVGFSTFKGGILFKMGSFWGRLLTTGTDTTGGSAKTFDCLSKVWFWESLSLSEMLYFSSFELTSFDSELVWTSSKGGSIIVKFEGSFVGDLTLSFTRGGWTTTSFDISGLLSRSTLSKSDDKCPLFSRSSAARITSSIASISCTRPKDCEGCLLSPPEESTDLCCGVCC